MTTNKPPPKQVYPVREVSRDTYRAILADEWPSPAGVTDFGIDSPEHLGALQYELRTGRVTLDQFDDALGWGPALTKLIGEDNPYRGVSFKTGWDDVMVPIREWATVSGELFPLGRLFATPEALKVTTQQEITDALQRHAAGDWGDGDKAENEAALKNEGEIVSSYRTESGCDVVVGTRSRRAMTLVLLAWQLDDL